MATSDRTFIFTVSAPPSSALEAACNALSSGQSAQFAGGTLSFGVGNMSFAHWSMAFHYDAIRKEFQALGKDAVLGGGTGRIRHAIYSEASSAWRSVREWGAGTSGHVYSGHTIEPATGDHYYIQWSDQFAQRYDRATDAWIGNTSTAGGSWASPPHALVAWHPNLFGSGDGGLVVLTRQTPVQVYFWRKATNAWSSMSASSFITVNTRDGAAIYSPALDAVVCGSGDSSLSMIRVDSGPSVQGIAAVPVAAGDHYQRNPLTTHPVSGKPMLLEQTTSADRYWVYESGTNSWDLQGTHPFNDVPSSASNHMFILCPVPAYGVLAALNVISSADQCRMDLWKPN